jgi:hypothetical protein
MLKRLGVDRQGAARRREADDKFALSVRNIAGPARAFACASNRVSARDVIENCRRSC